MVAFFIARDAVSTSSRNPDELEFTRYRAAVEGLSVEEHTTCDEMECDRRKYFVVRVGNDSVCVICESPAEEGMKSYLAFEQTDEEESRLVCLVERITAIVDALDLSGDKTWIFMHNGGDIPPGYETWVNNMLHGASGCGVWNFGFLSSQRKQCFDLTSMAMKKHLVSEVKLRNWVDSLGAKLLKVGK